MTLVEFADLGLFQRENRGTEESKTGEEENDRCWNDGFVAACQIEEYTWKYKDRRRFSPFEHRDGMTAPTSNDRSNDGAKTSHDDVIDVALFRSFVAEESTGHRVLKGSDHR